MHIQEILKNFEYFFSGKASDTEIVDFLKEFSGHPLTTEMLTEIVKLLRSKMIPVLAPTGTVDCCGTGGDSDVTGGSLNISTATAFMTASLGVPVAKHGNRAVSSRSGSADILEALGMDIVQSPDKASQKLHDTGLCFLFAPYFHPVLKYVAQARKAIGTKTIFNILGPLLNPASVKYQLLGVYDFSLAQIIAETLRATGTQKALIVRSHEGADELTLTGENDYCLLENGHITFGKISASDVGLPYYMSDDLRGGTPAENAQALRQMLLGQKGAYRDTVIFNTGALLYVAGKAKTIAEGVEIAKQSDIIQVERFF